MRTRVGYTGGSKKNPTYRSMGDHTETIQIDFDPGQTSYPALLEVFVNSHNPCARRGSRQYMSAIFYHTDKQREQAEEALRRVAKARGSETHTLVTQADKFYLAEDYHQKYRLRQDRSLVAEYLRIYPELSDFVNSTAVTRVNGYVAGYGRRADLQRELPQLGLSDEAAEKLLAKARR